MLSMHVPKYLWGDAVLIAAYLINQMVTKVLNFKTPLSHFKKFFFFFFSKFWLFSDLQIKVFECIVYVRTLYPILTKLDPLAVKCIFICYVSHKKAFKYFDPLTKKFLEHGLSLSPNCL